MNLIDKHIASLIISAKHPQRVVINNKSLSTQLGGPAQAKEWVPLITARLQNETKSKFGYYFLPFKGWVLFPKSKRAESAMIIWAQRILAASC